MEEDCKYQQRLIGSAFPTESKPLLVSFFSKIMKWMGLGKWWQKSFYGLKMQVSLWHRQGEPLKALHAIFDWLTLHHFEKEGSQKWWYLMRMAVSLAQDLPVNKNDVNSDLIKKLEKMGNIAPQPWQGFDVAYSFSMLSLWSLRQGKTQKAMEQVTIALHADPNWGTPEYLLGCYGLLLEGIDPVVHFARAIKINGHYLQQLNKDPLVAQYPDILQQVQKLVIGR